MIVPNIALAAPQQGNYVAIGDSLAAGMTPAGGFGQGYADFLAKRITDDQRTYENFGVPGLTSEDLKNILYNQPAQFPYIRSNIAAYDEQTVTVLVMKLMGISDPSNPYLSSVVAGLRSGNETQITEIFAQLSLVLNDRIQGAIGSADIITLNIGGNDLLLASQSGNPDVILDAITKVGMNTLAILNLLGQNQDAKIYVLGYPYNDQLTGTLNATIQKATASYAGNDTFVPTVDAFKKHYEKYLPANNVHPSHQGYMALTNILWSVIKGK
jgi:lysophospholipase L1-like esterase